MAREKTHTFSSPSPQGKNKVSKAKFPRTYHRGTEDAAKDEQGFSAPHVDQFFSVTNICYSRVSAKKIKWTDSANQNTCYIIYFHWKVTSVKLKKRIWGEMFRSVNLALRTITKLPSNTECPLHVQPVLGPARVFWHCLLLLHYIKGIIKSRPLFLLFTYKEHWNI